MTTSGTVTAVLASLTSVTDEAGNPVGTVTYTSNSVQFSAQFKPVLSSTYTGTTGANPLILTATFNEVVTGFDKSDVLVTTIPVQSTNFTATVGTVTSLDNKTFQIPITITGLVTNVSVVIAENTCTNSTNASNSASNTVQISTDYNPLVLAASDYFSPLNISVPVVPASLKIAFNKNVYKGSTGSILIRRVDNNEIVKTINLSGVTTLLKVATINPPTGDYPVGVQLYVDVPSTCFKDEYGNYYAGISGSGAQGWKFSTAVNLGTASNLNVVSKTKTSLRFTYTLPAGAKALVLVQAGTGTVQPGTTTFDATSVSSSTIALTPDLNYVSAPAVASYKLIYAGTATDITMLGLTKTTNYRIQVLTYNDAGTPTVFNYTNDVGTPIGITGTTCNTYVSKTSSYKIGAEDDEIGIEVDGNFTVSDVTPNPVNDQINFKVDSYEGADFSFTVYNMTGQELYTTTQLLNKGLNQVTIPVSKLGLISSGSYMIRVSDASGETIVPFVISK